MWNVIYDEQCKLNNTNGQRSRCNLSSCVKKKWGGNREEFLLTKNFNSMTENTGKYKRGDFRHNFKDSW